MYFLDTNTCIFYLNGKYESIRKKLLSIAPNEIGIPVLVKAELLLGAYKSKCRTENLEKVEKFLQPFEIIAFEDSMAYLYAEIRQNSELSGRIIGPNDVIIASIAKFHDGILVTNNTKEFRSIEGLNIEDWANIC